MSASSPISSGSSGSAATSSRASRIASAHSSVRTSRSPDVAVYPSLKIRYTTVHTSASRSASRSGGGTSKRIPASRILRFTRTSRCAIVACAMRNASAISSVVSPASVRSVSAMRASTRERRMTAREDQPEPVVDVLRHAGLRVDVGVSRRRGVEARENFELLAADALAAQPVDRAVARRREDPRRRLRRKAVARPALERGDERVLDRIFGQREVAEGARERCDRATGVVAEAARDASLDVSPCSQAAESRSSRTLRPDSPPRP